jgi:YesN/AraC family two-component response regulator
MARVLIIDDERPIRQLLRRMLEGAGHTVIDAADGLQAMALRREEPCDVVVTDIYMPGKDGIEVIREMKETAPKSKIIAMSGGTRMGLFDLMPAAIALGADRVLVKPFDQATFLQTVQEALR